MHLWSGQTSGPKDFPGVNTHLEKNGRWITYNQFRLWLSSLALRYGFWPKDWDSQCKCLRLASSVGRPGVEVESLLLWIKLSQLRQFVHLIRIPPEHLHLEVFLTYTAVGELYSADQKLTGCTVHLFWLGIPWSLPQWTEKSRVFLLDLLDFKIAIQIVGLKVFFFCLGI